MRPGSLFTLVSLMSLELGDNAALRDSYTGLKQVGVLIFPFGP